MDCTCNIWKVNPNVVLLILTIAVCFSFSWWTYSCALKDAYDVTCFVQFIIMKISTLTLYNWNLQQVMKTNASNIWSTWNISGSAPCQGEVRKPSRRNTGNNGILVRKSWGMMGDIGGTLKSLPVCCFFLTLWTRKRSNNIQDGCSLSAKHPWKLQPVLSMVAPPPL